MSWRTFARGAALFTGAAVLAVFFFLFLSAWPLIQSGEILQTWTGPWAPFATEPQFGVAPMIVVSVLMALGATALAFPLALGLVIFAHGIGPKKLSKVLRLLIQMTAGFPTVVYGFVSVMILVPMIRRHFESTSGFSLLAATLTLVVLILPTLVLIMEAPIQSQKKHWLVMGQALGLTRTQVLIKVLFPMARPTFLAAFILGFNRALGDTLIALMVAGNAAQYPGSLLDSVRSLTAHIALVLATDSFSPQYRSVAAAALILFLTTGCLSYGMRSLVQKVSRP